MKLVLANRRHHIQNCSWNFWENKTTTNELLAFQLFNMSEWRTNPRQSKV